MGTTELTTLSLIDWLPIVWLFVLLPPLILMKQWISYHIQITAFLLVQNQNVMLSLYHFIMLPGTIVHELSHWLMAQLLFVRIDKVTIPLLPKKSKGNQFILGNVQTVKTDPIRSSLIGVAPIFGGCAVILLIAHFAFDLPVPIDSAFSETLNVPNPPDLLTVLTALRSRIDTPDLWLWLYLIFAVSNAMLPSSSDRTTWGVFLILCGIIAGIIYLFWGIPQIPLELALTILIIISYLAYALGLTLIVNVIFIVIIALLEFFFGTLTRRKFS